MDIGQTEERCKIIRKQLDELQVPMRGGFESKQVEMVSVCLFLLSSHINMNMNMNMIMIMIMIANETPRECPKES
jgi:hypothetical protein